MWKGRFFLLEFLRVGLGRVAFGSRLKVCTYIMRLETCSVLVWILGVGF